MKRCFVVGAGSLYEGDLPFLRQKEDLVIAADGGYVPLIKAGMEPDLLIGDFDSMDEPAVSCEVIRLPVEKDDTDIAFAIKEGLARGYTEFVIYGGLGGNRLSHTLANVQLLAYMKEQGEQGTLVGGNTRLFILKEESRTFPQSTKGTLSVFAYSSSICVSLDGLQYPLDHATVTNAFPLGVSNHFIEKDAAVTVHEGTALVVVENE